MEDVAGIELADVHLRLADRCLVRGLNLRVTGGEFLVVAGPSGSGKTTLLRAMAGLLRPSEGKVRVWYRQAQQSCAIGFVYQHLRLALPWTALEAVCTGRLGQLATRQTLAGFPRSVRDAAYRELCNLGLREMAHQPVATLSGGERQRVAIARTLFQRPAIAFFDEPVANLDRANAQLVLARLRREASESGMAVIAVLHDDAQISLFADRILRWDSHAPSRWREERLRLPDQMVPRTSDTAATAAVPQPCTPADTARHDTARHDSARR